MANRVKHRSTVVPSAPQASSHRPILVVCLDSTTTHACVVQPRPAPWVTSAVSVPRTGDDRGLAACLEGLAQVHRHALPRRARVVTASATVASLDLPRTAVDGRSYRDLQGLLEWEVGAQLASMQPNRLGTQLVAMGALDDDQVADVRESLLMAADQNPEHGRTFGAEAIRLGFVNERDVQAGLEAQRAALDTGAIEMAYGWSSGATGLVAAIDVTERADLVEALRGLGRGVDAIYPLVGAANAMLPEGRRESGCGAVELHRDEYAFFHFGSGGEVEVARIPARLDDDPSLAVLDQVRAAHPRHLTIVGDDDSQARVIARLLDAGVDASGLEFARESAGTRLPCLIEAACRGAAAEAWGLPGRVSIPGIRAAAPPVPLVRRPAFFWLMGVAAVAAAVAGAEILTARRAEALEGRAQPISDQLREERDLTSTVKEARSRVTRLREEIARVEVRRESMRTLLQTRKGALTAASGGSVDVLDALRRSINDQVAVDHVNRSEGRLRVEAWALNEPALEAFQRSLEERLTAHGWGSVDRRTFPLVGRLGLQGFVLKVEFRAPGRPNAEVSGS